MGLQVTVYSDSDVGAPQIGSGTWGASWISIIKACLVGGYGSKLPLGWTVEYENNATDASAYIIFKNSMADGGSGCYLKVQPSTSSIITFTVFKSMSSPTDYTQKIASRSGYIYGSSTGWHIIGTSRGFYIMQDGFVYGSYKTCVGMGSNASYSFTYFIGDIESSMPNDPSTFTIVSGSNSLADITSTHYSYHIGAANNLNVPLYGTDGTNTITLYDSNLGSDYVTTASIDLEPERDQLPVMVQKVALCSSTKTSIAPPFRGFVTGLNSLGFVGFSTQPYPLVLAWNNKSYFVLRGQYAAHMVIDLGDWYV
jgi:hypothetical protein